jgi:hypothetical protein
MDVADSELIKGRRNGDIAPRPGDFSTPLEKARLAPNEPGGDGDRHEFRPPGLRGPIGHKEHDVRIDVEGVLQEPWCQAKRRECVQDYPRGPNIGEAVWVAHRVRTAACGIEERDPMAVTVCEQVSGKGALSPILYALEPRTLHTPRISVFDRVKRRLRGGG